MTASLDRDVASLFCVGFHGTAPSPEVRELVRRGVHGVILFARNVVDAEQVAALVAELKRLADRPLLVAIDQEGGRVARLRAPQGFTELPPMRALGETGDADLAREVGGLLGSELRAVGIDQSGTWAPPPAARASPSTFAWAAPPSQAVSSSGRSRRVSDSRGSKATARARRGSSRSAPPVDTFTCHSPGSRGT